MRSGCGLDVVKMQSRCSLDAVWMRSGCGLDAVCLRSGCSLDAVWTIGVCLSLFQITIEWFRTFKAISVRTDGWDGYLGDYVC